MRTSTLAWLTFCLLGCASHSPTPAPHSPAASGDPLGPTSPEHLQTLAAAFDRESDPKAKERIASEMDRFAHQRDSVSSRLFWYTDLEEAKRAAKASGRPILSLRLLGRLDEEFSCANSRFFRTALYPNAVVSESMRRDFILHWSTERPAPLMTIDFGDGRVVKRTVTGNSLHYVLDENGRPIDAIPGLYSPSAFRERLDWARNLAQSLRGKENRAQLLAQAHNEELKRVASAWQVRGFEDRSVTFADLSTGGQPKGPDLHQPANLAMPRAMSKARIETPLLDSKFATEAEREARNTRLFQQIGAETAANVSLDDRAIHAMRKKAPHDWSSASSPLIRNEETFLTLVDQFKKSMAADTARNEFSFHPVIHRWIANAPEMTLDDLNRRVYAELFLTPASDPWLGLLPPTTYTGLQDDGFVPSR